MGAFVTLHSCKNDESSLFDEPSGIDKSINILKFTSEVDYNNMCVKIHDMSKEERILWEEQNKLKSFGSIAEELYSSIDFESLKNIEELNELVSQHNEYLEYFEDANGETTLEISLYVTIQPLAIQVSA
jgi:hypothetical protein